MSRGFRIYKNMYRKGNYLLLFGVQGERWRLLEKKTQFGFSKNQLLKTRGLFAFRLGYAKEGRN